MVWQKYNILLKQFYFLLMMLYFIIFSNVTAEESEINSNSFLNEIDVTTVTNQGETTTKTTATKTIVTRGRRQNCGMDNRLCNTKTAILEKNQSLKKLPLNPLPQQIQSCVCKSVQQDPCCALQQEQKQQYMPSMQPLCICLPEQQSESNFNDPCCVQQKPSPLPPLQTKLSCVCTAIQQDPCCNIQNKPSPLPTSPLCECIRLTLRIQPPCICPPPIVHEQHLTPPPPQPICVCTPVQQDPCCLTQLMQQAPSSLSSSQLQQKTVLNCKTCVQQDNPLCCDQTQIQSKPQCICTSTQQDSCCPQTIQHSSILPSPKTPSQPQTFCLCSSVQTDPCCQQTYPPHPRQSKQEKLSQIGATCVCTALQQDSCCSTQIPQKSLQPNISHKPCVCTKTQQDSCCLTQQLTQPQMYLPLSVQGITIQCAPFCDNINTESKFDAHQSLKKQQLTLPPLVIMCRPSNCQCKPNYSQCAANKCCLQFSSLEHKTLFKKLMHKSKA